MELKVGDKVKVLKSSDFPEMVGKIYTVSQVMRPDSAFSCRIIEEKTGWSPLMFEYEIEPYVCKGEQQVFEFML